MPWSYDIREDNTYGGTSKHRANAKIHGDILRNTLQSAVIAMRAEKCSKLMFGGRDVWTLAVLAEKRKIPYLFIPELSRHVSKDPAIKDFLALKGFTGDELFVDTGFAGSIPRNLMEHFGRAFKFRLMSQTSVGYRDMVAIERTPEQLFPCRKRAREEALQTEYLAKYWKTGTIDSGRVTQYIATHGHVQRAALITSMLWRGVPSFQPRQSGTHDKWETPFFSAIQKSFEPKKAKTAVHMPYDDDVKNTILMNALQTVQGRTAILAAMAMPIHILEQQNLQPPLLNSVNRKLNILNRVVQTAKDKGEPEMDGKGPSVAEIREKLMKLRNKLIQIC
jgi:hypothetical protein